MYSFTNNRTYIYIYIYIDGSLDQAGCMEMRTLATMTGGYLVVSDSFINQIFKKSFVKIFEKGETSGTMELGYKSQIQVFTSKMVKICGAIGHCSSMQKKTASVADVTIGIGGTSQWRIGSIDKNTTLAFYFDVINQSPIGEHSPVFFQFQTKYLHSSGQQRIRVTTIQRKFSLPDNIRELALGKEHTHTHTYIYIYINIIVFRI